MSTRECLLDAPALNATLQLRPNSDFKSRVTYSAKLDALATNIPETYIDTQLYLAGLPRHTFTDEAPLLVQRVSEGVLRAVRNLCAGLPIEAVCDRTKTVDLKQVNAALMQPHWRHSARNEAQPPVVLQPETQGLTPQIRFGACPPI